MQQLFHRKVRLLKCVWDIVVGSSQCQCSVKFIETGSIGLVPDKLSLTQQTPRMHCVLMTIPRENWSQLTNLFPRDLCESTRKSAVLSEQRNYSRCRGYNCFNSTHISSFKTSRTCSTLNFTTTPSLNLHTALRRGHNIHTLFRRTFYTERATSQWTGERFMWPWWS